MIMRTTERRKKKKQFYTILLVSVIVMWAACVFLFCITYVVLGDYNGLGPKKSLKPNTLKQKNYFYDHNFLEYKDKNHTSEKGIDVSVFQGNIDWKKVRGTGVKFVMIRIGYSGSDTGKIFKDTNYIKNLEGAKKAGIKVGVYFFSQAITTEEAVKEAKFVIRNIRRKGIEYPVAYDMEPSEGSRINKLSTKERTEITDAFCSIIKSHGYETMVYGNLHWLTTKLDMEYLTAYGTWLAHYTDKTAYPNRFDMWQYSEKGRVEGIKKKVDLNIRFLKNN